MSRFHPWTFVSCQIYLARHERRCGHIGRLCLCARCTPHRPPVPSAALSYCMCVATSVNGCSVAPQRRRSCCTEPPSCVAGGRLLLVAALVAATASLPLHGANVKRCFFAKGSRSRLKIPCAPTSSSERALSRCCTGAAQGPLRRRTAGYDGRGRGGWLRPVADRQVARVWSARGLQVRARHISARVNLKCWRQQAWSFISRPSLNPPPRPPRGRPAHPPSPSRLCAHARPPQGAPPWCPQSLPHPARAAAGAGPGHPRGLFELITARPAHGPAG